MSGLLANAQEINVFAGWHNFHGLRGTNMSVMYSQKIIPHLDVSARLTTNTASGKLNSNSTDNFAPVYNYNSVGIGATTTWRLINNRLRLGASLLYSLSYAACAEQNYHCYLPAFKSTTESGTVYETWKGFGHNADLILNVGWMLNESVSVGVYGNVTVPGELPELDRLSLGAYISIGF